MHRSCTIIPSCASWDFSNSTKLRRPGSTTTTSTTTSSKNRPFGPTGIFVLSFFCFFFAAPLRAAPRRAVRPEVGPNEVVDVDDVSPQDADSVVWNRLLNFAEAEEVGKRLEGSAKSSNVLEGSQRRGSVDMLRKGKEEPAFGRLRKALRVLERIEEELEKGNRADGSIQVHVTFLKGTFDYHCK